MVRARNPRVRNVTLELAEAVAKLREMPGKISLAEEEQTEAAAIELPARRARDTALANHKLAEAMEAAVQRALTASEEALARAPYCCYSWSPGACSCSTCVALRDIQKHKPELEEKTREVAKTSALSSKCTAQWTPASQSLGIAEKKLTNLRKEQKKLQKKTEKLTEEESEKQDVAERFCIMRRAKLPSYWGKKGQGAVEAFRVRLAQLANVVEMDWVVKCSTPQRELVENFFFSSWETVGSTDMIQDLQTFLGRPEVQLSLRQQQEKRTEMLYSVGGRYMLIEKSFLKELQSPARDEPPTKLGFFELLRVSAGAQKIKDLVLEPEGAGFCNKVLGLDRVHDLKPPKSLQKRLRPYQVDGFQWLASLARNGLGAILADDMGLGKTLQAIALLLYLKEANLLCDEQGRPCPALVVVPPGLLGNWQEELQQWAPALRVRVYHGPHRALPVFKGSCDVLLTTYSTVRLDVQKLCDKAQVVFSAMVIDEAQTIKNHSSQTTKAVKEVGQAVGHTRVALSGTPVENKILELHSLMDFTNPGFLHGQREFQDKHGRFVSQAKATETSQEKVELLKQLIRPFQLRRLKTDPAIALDLPPKICKKEEVTLTMQQAQLYRAVQEEWQQTLRELRANSSNPDFDRNGHVFKMLNVARLICAHPACLEAKHLPKSMSNFQAARDAKGSGKMERLIGLLEGIFENSDTEKVLIFVTRYSVMYLLRELIQRHFPLVAPLVFSGEQSLQEREAAAERFSSIKQCRVMILTVQAGGVGHNFTSANHVIHFDRVYNPAKEAQATDRSHRIGQVKTVMEHILVTKDTFEERLEAIMQKKSKLASLVSTTGEDWIAKYNDEELAELFALNPVARKRSLEPPETPPPGVSVSLDSSPETAPKLPAPDRRFGSYPGTSPTKRPRI